MASNHESINSSDSECEISSVRMKGHKNEKFLPTVKSYSKDGSRTRIHSVPWSLLSRPHDFGNYSESLASSFYKGRNL